MELYEVLPKIWNYMKFCQKYKVMSYFCHISGVMASFAKNIKLCFSSDSLRLSRNQVNVPISAMSDALHSLGARVCRVSFFGMKWEIIDAEPTIDRFIQRYCADMGSFVPTQKNMFDYGVQFPTRGLELYKFSEVQREAQRFRV